MPVAPQERDGTITATYVSVDVSPVAPAQYPRLPDLGSTQSNKGGMMPQPAGSILPPRRLGFDTPISPRSEQTDRPELGTVTDGPVAAAAHPSNDGDVNDNHMVGPTVPDTADTKASQPERERITENNVLKPSQSLRILVVSLQQVYDRARQRPEDTRAQIATLTGCDPDYLFDGEAQHLVAEVDSARLESSETELVALLELFQIEMEQLDFTERLFGLEHLQICAMLSEARRAFVPIARMLGGEAGADLDFNRLNVWASVSSALPTLPEQLRYLSENLGIQPDSGDQIKGIHYISFRGSYVGFHPGADVYVHLMMGDFPPALTT